MDNWADPGMDPGFFVRRRGGGGCSKPDVQNTGSAHGTKTHVCAYAYIHAHVQTGT